VTAEVLAGRVTLVVALAPEVAANLAPDDVDARLTVIGEAFVVAVPELVSSVTVNAFVAEVPAVAVNAVEVMTSLVPLGAVIVSVWVPDVRPVADAVMVGVPATESA
jgi:hypothetical protein